MEDYVRKNYGTVAAHSSWPLLYIDVLYAIEEQPPESMVEWSSTHLGANRDNSNALFRLLTSPHDYKVRLSSIFSPDDAKAPVRRIARWPEINWYSLRGHRLDFVRQQDGQVEDHIFGDLPQNGERRRFPVNTALNLNLLFWF